MLLLLYGKDTFRSSEKLKEIIQSYKNSGKTGLNVVIQDAGDLFVETAEQELVSVPMFKERKLLILKHVFHEKLMKEFFLSRKKLLQESSHVIVFFEEEDIPAKDTLLQFLEKNEKSQKFDLLSESRIASWIVAQGKEYEIDFSKEACRELCMIHQSDLWALSQEIRKLASFKQSEQNKTVSLEDVKLLSPRASIETDIFATIDQIARKKKEKALELLHKHLSKGDSPVYLLSMIHFQFRNLLQVKEYTEASTSMHPFVVRKSRELASLFTIEELKAMYERIWQSDYAVKTGAMDGETALDMLLLRPVAEL